MTGLDETFPLALLPLCVSMSQPTFSGTDFQKYMSAIERNVIRLCSVNGHRRRAAYWQFDSDILGGVQIQFRGAATCTVISSKRMTFYFNGLFKEAYAAS